MRNKAIFCFIILLTLFLSVSVISASENNTCDNLNSVDGDAIEVPSADADLDELSLSDGNLNEVSSADEDSDKVLSSDANLNEVSSADNAVIASDDAKSSTVISAKDKTSYVDYKDKFTVQLTSGGKALANKPVTITLNNVKYNKVTKPPRRKAEGVRRALDHSACTSFSPKASQAVSPTSNTRRPTG